MGKSASTALLAQAGGKSLAFAVIAIETAVYLLYKLLRRDFRYWLPLPKGTSLATSLIARVTAKVITDYTGMLHTRHPLEMGGCYWLMNQVYIQISVFIVLTSRMNVDDSNLALKNNTLWRIGFILASMWFIAMITLLYFCNSEYRHTFYSTWTSRDYQKKRFEEGDDKTKFTILTTVHRRVWKSFEVEMEEWMANKWGSLNREKPDWFTESAIARIPSDMIPHLNTPSVREEALKDGTEKTHFFLQSERRMTVMEGLESLAGLHFIHKKKFNDPGRHLTTTK